MEFYISQKMREMKPSTIREFFKFAADPAVISMSAGSPCPEALPVQAIRDSMSRIMQEDIEKALTYSISEGYPPLRESLKAYVRDEYQSFADGDDVLVFSGAMQCMDLLTKVLCDEGDAVICEDPTFTGSLNVFRSYGARLIGIPTGEGGMDLDMLEAALKREKRVRFIYVIPNFQNPTGYTTSLETRKGILALGLRYGVPVLEDDPYGDLRFAGEPIPSIKSMDKDGMVFYSRTFSKVLSAGIRVGYLITPSSLSGLLTVGKQCADVHTGMLSQLLCHRFLTEYDIGAHIKEISAIYGRKCGLMLDALGKLPPEKISFTRPQGGLFVWATLSGVEDCGEFAMRLVKEKKVAVVSGSGFFTHPGKSPTFRMTFAAPSDSQIVEGIARIGEMI